MEHRQNEFVQLPPLTTIPVTPSYARAYAQRPSMGMWGDPSANEGHCLLHQNLSVPRFHPDVKFDPAVIVDEQMFEPGA